jgi:hypothetical protein
MKSLRQIYFNLKAIEQRDFREALVNEMQINQGTYYAWLSRGVPSKYIERFDKFINKYSEKMSY